jgi:hypothetical protein
MKNLTEYRKECHSATACHLSRDREIQAEEKHSFIYPIKKAIFVRLMCTLY